MSDEQLSATGGGGGTSDSTDENQDLTLEYLGLEDDSGGGNEPSTTDETASTADTTPADDRGGGGRTTPTDSGGGGSDTPSDAATDGGGGAISSPTGRAGIGSSWYGSATPDGPESEPEPVGEPSEPSSEPEPAPEPAPTPADDRAGGGRTTPADAGAAPEAEIGEAPPTETETEPTPAEDRAGGGRTTPADAGAAPEGEVGPAPEPTTEPTPADDRAGGGRTAPADSDAGEITVGEAIAQGRANTNPEPTEDVLGADGQLSEAQQQDITAALMRESSSFREQQQGVEATTSESADRAAAYESQLVANNPALGPSDISIERQDDRLVPELTPSGREALGVNQTDEELLEPVELGTDTLGTTRGRSRTLSPAEAARLNTQLQTARGTAADNADRVSSDVEAARRNRELAGRRRAFEANTRERVERYQRDLEDASEQAGPNAVSGARERRRTDLEDATAGPSATTENYVPQRDVPDIVDQALGKTDEAYYRADTAVANNDLPGLGDAAAGSTDEYIGRLTANPDADEQVVQEFTRGGLLSESQEQSLRQESRNIRDSITTADAGPARRFGEGGYAALRTLPQNVAIAGEQGLEIFMAAEGAGRKYGAGTLAETGFAVGRDTTEQLVQSVENRPYRTTGGLAAEIAVSLGAGVAGRAALNRASGRLQTRGIDFQGEVDRTDIVREDIREGPNRLTTFSERAVPGGRRSTPDSQFPIEPADSPEVELRRLAEEYSDADLEEALDIGSEESTLFSARTGTKGSDFTPRSGRSYDPDASFFAGSVAENFLPTGGPSGSSLSLSPRLPRFRQAARQLTDAARQESTPTIIATGGRVRMLPDDVRTRGEITDFLREQSDSGEFYVRQPDNQSGEAEALTSAEGTDKVDPDLGAGRTTADEATTFVRVDDPFLTRVDGERVPIQLYRQAGDVDPDTADAPASAVRQLQDEGVDAIDDVSDVDGIETRSSLADELAESRTPGSEPGTPVAPTVAPSAGAGAGGSSPGASSPTTPARPPISPGSSVPESRPGGAGPSYSPVGNSPSGGPAGGDITELVPTSQRDRSPIGPLTPPRTPIAPSGSLVPPGSSTPPLSIPASTPSSTPFTPADTPSDIPIVETPPPTPTIPDTPPTPPTPPRPRPDDDESDGSRRRQRSDELIPPAEPEPNTPTFGYYAETAQGLVQGGFATPEAPSAAELESIAATDPVADLPTEGILEGDVNIEPVDDLFGIGVPEVRR